MSAVLSDCGRYRYRLDGQADTGLLDAYPLFLRGDTKPTLWAGAA